MARVGGSAWVWSSKEIWYLSYDKTYLSFQVKRESKLYWFKGKKWSVDLLWANTKQVPKNVQSSEVVSAERFWWKKFPSFSM